jgi:hypothetical protein
MLNNAAREAYINVMKLNHDQMTGMIHVIMTGQYMA